MFEEIAECSSFADLQGLSTHPRLIAAASVALVPNPSAPPFYFDPLYNSNGEKLDSVLQRFYAYDPSRLILVDEYKENIMQLNAFGLDCGTKDGNSYKENMYFAGIL